MVYGILATDYSSRALAQSERIYSTWHMTRLAISGLISHMPHYVMPIIGRTCDEILKKLTSLHARTAYAINLLPENRLALCTHYRSQTIGETASRWILLGHCLWTRDATVYYLLQTDLARTSDYPHPDKHQRRGTGADFFNHWYCENGLPKDIISDRDKLFVSKFWASLHKLTGVKLKLSSAYHPKTDGASERTNKTINQSIRYHVQRHQKGWVRALPRIRFDIMNSVNASTGFSHFQLRLGRSPRVIDRKSVV